MHYLPTSFKEMLENARNNEDHNDISRILNWYSATLLPKQIMESSEYQNDPGNISRIFWHGLYDKQGVLSPESFYC
jgi:hypothetical protein